MAKLTKQTKAKNWRLQKGAKVEWHDGHKKGTGVIVKPINDDSNIVIGLNGTKYYGSANSYIIKDDNSGEKITILTRNLNWLKKDKDQK
jgi:hypothetical protein